MIVPGKVTPFITQLVECAEEACMRLKFCTYKEYPEFMPRVPSNGIMGIDRYECLIFGGLCSSSNPGCVELRTEPIRTGVK